MGMLPPLLGNNYTVMLLKSILLPTDIKEAFPLLTQCQVLKRKMLPAVTYLFSNNALGILPAESHGRS